MYVHGALARALHDNDVRHLFGVLGDANLHVVHGFDALDGTEYVATASEGGAVLAALGYAQVSGRLGVATVTHGPGLTNTLTALVEAQRARIPLLLLAGDTPAAAHDHIQDIDQRPIAAAAGARFVPIRSAASAVADLAAAMRLAWTERLPVVANLPIELQWDEAEYLPASGQPARLAPEPDRAAVEAAVGVIASARRPVVLAGRGVAVSDAAPAVLALAERIGAPVATTLRGKDLFAGLPHDLGVFGSLSDEVANEVISRADCVVALGCGLNRWTSAEGSLLRGKSVVHVDIDPGRLNQFSPATVAVAGDAAKSATAMVELLDEAEVPPTHFVAEASAKVGQRTRIPVAADRGSDSAVDIRTALQRVDEVIPKDRIVITDNGRFILSAFTALHVEHPRLYAHAVNFGAIGLGLSTAIGASYAEPDRTVLVAIGDGGFALGGLSDLVTAVTQRRRIVVLLLNDNAYGAEYVQLRNRGIDPMISTLPWPDFGPIAEAIGAQGYTVRNRKELDAALEAIDVTVGPALLDVRIDPDQV